MMRLSPVKDTDTFAKGYSANSKLLLTEVYYGVYHRPIYVY